MTFSEIIADARRFAKASVASLPTADIVTSANSALERAVAIIRESEGRWQWDDSNYTTFPNATTTLTANQQDYELDPTHYRIERVEVKNEDGNWGLLTPIDQIDIYNQSLTDFLNTAGDPKYYDKVGDSLMLYPKPDYTQAASLKVFYQRGPSYFTATDTSKEPGFNKLFHRLIPLWVAYDYCLINSGAAKDALRIEIDALEENLKNHYLLRGKDERIRLTTRRGSFR